MITYGAYVGKNDIKEAYIPTFRPEITQANGRYTKLVSSGSGGGFY